MVTVLRSDEELSQALQDRGSGYSIVLFAKDIDAKSGKDLMERGMDKLAMMHKGVAFFKMAASDGLQCCAKLPELPSAFAYSNSIGVAGVIGEDLRKLMDMANVIGEKQMKQLSAVNGGAGGGNANSSKGNDPGIHAKMSGGSRGSPDSTQHNSQSSTDDGGYLIGDMCTTPSPVISNFKGKYRSIMDFSLENSKDPLRGRLEFSPTGGSLLESTNKHEDDDDDDDVLIASLDAIEQVDSGGCKDPQCLQKKLELNQLVDDQNRIYREMQDRNATEKAQLAAELKRVNTTLEEERSRMKRGYGKELEDLRLQIWKETNNAKDFQRKWNLAQMWLDAEKEKVVASEQDNQKLRCTLAHKERMISNLQALVDLTRDDDDGGIHEDQSDFTLQLNPMMASTPNAHSNDHKIDHPKSSSNKQEDEMSPLLKKGKYDDRSGGGGGELLPIDEVMAILNPGMEESMLNANDKVLESNNLGHQTEFTHEQQQVHMVDPIGVATMKGDDKNDGLNKDGTTEGQNSKDVDLMKMADEKNTSGEEKDETGDDEDDDEEEDEDDDEEGGTDEENMDDVEAKLRASRKKAGDKKK